MSLRANYFRHFGAIGFPVHNQVEFEHLLKRALESGRMVPAVTGKYVAWAPGEGVEVWVKIKDRSVVRCTPHYVGEGALMVEATALYARSADEVADGALRGAVLPVEAGSAAYPAIFDLPGFEAVGSRLSLPATVSIQAAALAQEMRCFATEAAYVAWRQQNVPPEDTTGVNGSDHTAASVTFPDFTAADLSPGAIPAATVRLTGRVLKAQMRTNPATGQNFLALVVRAPGGGTLDIAAEPQTASGDLTVGGVVTGTFRLSGRVQEVSAAASDTAAATESPRSAAPAVLSRLTHLLRGNGGGGD